MKVDKDVTNAPHSDPQKSSEKKNSKKNCHVAKTVNLDDSLASAWHKKRKSGG